MIFIVSGEKDSGKTTFAGNIVSVLQKKGFVVRGFLSVGKQGTGLRKRFDLLELAEMRFFPLAEPESKPGYTVCGPYYFNPETLQKGEVIIRTAIHDKAEIVVMDEIGKCELKGRIWDSAFRSALSASCNLLIVVSEKNLHSIISSYTIENFLSFKPSQFSVRKAVSLILNHLD
jgi:nucleoside-triphosphatase THEP1